MTFTSPADHLHRCLWHAPAGQNTKEMISGSFVDVSSISLYRSPPFVRLKSSKWLCSYGSSKPRRGTHRHRTLLCISHREPTPNTFETHPCTWQSHCILFNGPFPEQSTHPALLVKHEFPPTRLYSWASQKQR